jgi:replicative DNA helicase
MSDSANTTTSIMDLPTDPANGGNMNNNINLNASEQMSQSNMQNMQNMKSNTNASSISLDQTTINQIVNGLQQASVTGATQLPSRDIPMTTSNLTHDMSIQPNFIPPVPQSQMHSEGDYINNYQQAGDIMNEYNSNIERSSSLDDMYNEIQVPILLAVLYFLFQLPFFRKFLFSYFPVLFSNDGNLNINGYIFMSSLFGIFYYLLNKVNTHFGKF